MMSKLKKYFILGFVSIVIFTIYHSLIANNPSLHCKDYECPTGVKILDPLEDTDNCYRAAVFEFAAEFAKNNDSLCPVTRDANLAKLVKVTKLAGRNGAQIIVFPEDGIFYCQRDGMYLMSPEIPDPELLNDSNNNPCLQPDKFATSVELRNLSCAARENNIYVVANFGTKQLCEPNTKVLDAICPHRGYFVFNTDVVLDNEGRFIKRYRKFNLFLEYFDKAPSLEHAYFDTDFGRFGLFTCFDMIFKRPAVDLVEKYHINTALFPTLWYDELPLLTAIQYQDGWSFKNKVNLLASNVHNREAATVGSGIFSANNFLYTDAFAQYSRLLIANLPKNNSVISKCSKNFEPYTLDVGEKDGYPIADYFGDIFATLYNYWNFIPLPSDTYYKLNKLEDKQTVCSGKVCCTISYKVGHLESPDLLNKIVLIARDANRPGNFNWYEQVCALGTLESPIDYERLNATRYSKSGYAGFSQLKLESEFDTEYVYPIAAYNVSVLIDRTDRQYNCSPTGNNKTICSLSYTGESSTMPIYSFGLYGRIYESDIMPKGW